MGDIRSRIILVSALIGQYEEICQWSAAPSLIHDHQSLSSEINTYCIRTFHGNGWDCHHVDYLPIPLHTLTLVILFTEKGLPWRDIYLVLMTAEPVRCWQVWHIAHHNTSVGPVLLFSALSVSLRIHYNLYSKAGFQSPPVYTTIYSISQCQLSKSCVWLFHTFFLVFSDRLNNRCFNHIPQDVNLKHN